MKVINIKKFFRRLHSLIKRLLTLKKLIVSCIHYTTVTVTSVGNGGRKNSFFPH